MKSSGQKNARERFTLALHRKRVALSLSALSLSTPLAKPELKRTLEAIAAYKNINEYHTVFESVVTNWLYQSVMPVLDLHLKKNLDLSLLIRIIQTVGLEAQQIVEGPIVGHAQTLIRSHFISITTSGQEDQKHLSIVDSMLDYITTKIHPLLNVFTTSVTQTWMTRLEFFMYTLVIAYSHSKIFDLIVEYPESIPFLHNLHACHVKCGAAYRSDLKTILLKDIKKRLTVINAGTNDLLVHYVNTHACLRIVSGKESVAEFSEIFEAMKQYLR